MCVCVCVCVYIYIYLFLPAACLPACHSLPVSLFGHEAFVARSQCGGSVCRVTRNYTHLPTYTRATYKERERRREREREREGERLSVGGRWCGVATVKTRPTHSSCRDSVGLLAPRYMDGFCQPPLSLALFPHAYVRTRPCLFSLRSCPPRYQPGETIYFTGLALRSTGVVEFSLSLSLSLFLSSLLGLFSEGR